MPDQDGKLTPTEIQKVADWLNQKSTTTLPCPVCANTTWAIGEFIVASRVYVPKSGIQLRGRLVPEVITYCENCNYTRHFVAVPILGPNLDGELPSEQKEETSAPSKVEAANG